MIWNQTYLLFGCGLGVSCLVAAMPIFTLLLLLGVLRKPAWLAGLSALAVAFLLATEAYRMPLRIAIGAATDGAAFGLFPISWIIFWAIALFRVTVETGQFEIVKNSIARLTPDPRLQALLIAFAFGGFLEGASGFGTPVAIAATMLIGLGFSAFDASAICLLANTAPVAFGSIGIPVITLAGITGLSVSKLSAAVGAVCAPTTAIIPIYLMLAIGGLRAASGIWSTLLLAGGVFGGVQFLVSNYIGPQLTDILASLSTLAALVALLRWRRFRRSGGQLEAGPVEFGHTGFHAVSEDGLQVAPPLRSVLHAWTPYGLLVACVLLWGWHPLQPWLNKPTILIPWPWLNDLTVRMPPIAAAPTPFHAVFAFNWLAAAGTACMAATLLSVAFLRMSLTRFLRLLRGVVRQLARPTATIATVLAMAFLMNYSGATVTLGLGFAATGAMFPFFSAMLGWLGVFLTGSDTSANALFGSLQAVTAERLGLSPVLMAAVNSSGGVMGKMISVQTIAIAAAATGLTQADQSRLFRFTLKHSLILASITGGIALLYAYALKIA